VSNWDADSDRLQRNLIEAARAARDAARDRRVPTVELARAWHATTMQGLAVVIDGRTVEDHDYFATFRGEPGLEDCEVRVGVRTGTPARDVADNLAAFEATLGRAAAALDAVVPPGRMPEDADQLDAVITLAAWAHAEWVRIHPFANGNGRTARLWANFVAMRYGLPPFVTLRPRPDGGYADAGARAMEGAWRPTVAVFRRLYLDTIAGR
jgi:hypothetical protein